ncbi:ribonuclease HI family protein, partial [Enterobacter cloacae complex sp. GF14B]|uniref:ribonuclease HI family protein n=1 Tax=Enterobacter cloacae complex sp. GF14B TaxID=2511982 RepID=UPI001027E39F
QEFDYTVQVESTTRASLGGLMTYQVFEREEKQSKEGEVRLPPLPPMVEGAYSLYFDGAYKRASDKAAAGIVVFDDKGTKVFSLGQLLDSHSNNEAEYAALTKGLQWCVSQGVQRLNVFGDALLLVRQVNGAWTCKNPSLRTHLSGVKTLLGKFEEVQIHHIPRAQNQEADALASERL